MKSFKKGSANGPRRPASGGRHHLETFNLYLNFNNKETQENFTLTKSFLLILFASFCFLRTLTTIDSDSDSSHTLNPSKLSHFGILSSNGASLKSKLNIFHPKFPPKPIKNNNFLALILILSSDIEINPGPRAVKFPCGVCGKNCPEGVPAVECGRCRFWYHTSCMFMNSLVYKSLKNISWECCQCGLPKFSSGLFQSSTETFDSLYNPFDSLDPRCCSQQPNSFFDPQTPKKQTPPLLSSTPKRCPKDQFSKRNPNLDLNTLVINFQSLWKKRVELSNLACDTGSDIIIGTETWLTPEHKNSELMLDDYDIFRRDRPTKGGGVLIAVKKNLCCEELSSSKDSEIIFCKIKIKGKKPLIVGSAYRPPNLDFENSKKLVDEIYKVNDKNKNAVFWLGGDFNLPDINWKTHEINSNQYLKSINSLFIEMAQDLGLSQIVDVPTRGTSFLDLLFTNNPGFVKKCSLIAGLGDHEIARIHSTLNPFRKKPTKRTIHLWNKVDEAKIQKETHEFRLKFLDLFTPDSSVTDMWDFIKNGFEKIIEDNVPSKSTSTKAHQPWINTETKRLIRKKNRWFKYAKEANSGKVWKTYRKIKSECQRTCRQTHDNFLNDIFSKDSSNKKLWSYIKSKKQESSGISDLRNKNNILTSDPVEKAHLIHQQFDSVFSNPSPKIQANFDEKDRLPTLNPIKISSRGILKLLSNLNPNKAIGPDNVPGKFLKLCANEIADIYQVLFQASLDQGVVPPDWKEANIVPLFKKGDKFLPENYRPISLTSLSCKLLEHVVHSTIMTHFDKFEVLDDAQHGFRKRRSCVSQLISTLDDFANCLKNQQQIDAILLDFSKAFDKVDHEGLILKLEHLGIRNSLLNWIRSFLIGRNQRVVIEGKESSPTKVLSGVPQGTVLGPLFFLVYINDISKGLSEGTKLKLFADDSLLYRIIKNPSDSAILQKDLDTLQIWGKKMENGISPRQMPTFESNK